MLSSSVRAVRQPSVLLVATVVIGAALVAWVVTASSTLGMTQGMSTGLLPAAPAEPRFGLAAVLLSLAWFVGAWTTMMAAMMLPSAIPMILAYASITYAHVQRAATVRLCMAWFMTGYFMTWVLYGLVAYALYAAIARLGMARLEWHGAGSIVAGAALIAAGLYQLTALKRSCLGRCRSPLLFLSQHWRPGQAAAFRMGMRHGLWCVGCCAGLMALLFITGAMSLEWMGVLATLVFAEKILPWPWVRPAIALGCVVAGATLVTTVAPVLVA